jgi:hypothetical protein
MPYELSWTPRPAYGNEALRFDFATVYFTSILVQGKIGFNFLLNVRAPPNCLLIAIHSVVRY